MKGVECFRSLHDVDLFEDKLGVVGMIKMGMNVVALRTRVCLGGHFKYYSNIYHKGAAIAIRHTTFSTKNNIWSYFQTLYL
jgi:hypothetical protein